jgi:hypothetical protein
MVWAPAIMTEFRGFPKSLLSKSGMASSLGCDLLALNRFITLYHPTPYSVHTASVIEYRTDKDMNRTMGYAAYSEDTVLLWTRRAACCGARTEELCVRVVSSVGTSAVLSEVSFRSLQTVISNAGIVT